MARRRKAHLLAAAVVAVTLSPATPAVAAPVERYIVFVDYYSDAGLTTLVGSRTWNNCPGEEGTYGWGAQTPYHVTTSEPC
ncbi:MAG: hypothetical protein HOY78_29785 [Saccharothrix sp.]|nr:hypothetical protein [Saccharothrix sp.]